MNAIRAVMAVSVLLMCQEATAQMFKCTDKAGKVTYSSTKCSEIGLKDAGEIKDRLQVTPAPPATTPAPPAAAPAASAPRPPSPPVSGPVVQPDAPKPAAAVDPANPDKPRCFVVTGAGGKKVTRCNDGRPDEAAE